MSIFCLDFKEEKNSELKQSKTDWKSQRLRRPDGPLQRPDFLLVDRREEEKKVWEERLREAVDATLGSSSIVGMDTWDEDSQPGTRE